MTRNVIAVYHDEGSGEFTRACLVHALSEHFAGTATVRRIRAEEICTSDAWHAETRLLAFPGGADRPYMRKLNGAGTAAIQRYIADGGAFLGVCAGAYYASARIAFEAGTSQQIFGTRELVLFEGTARGSLHELAAPYDLTHLHCAAVVTLRATNTQEDLHALYWGGPEFLPDPGANYRALLTYVTPDGRDAIAALRTEVGRGRVVLSGVHAEVLGSQFPIEVSHFADTSFEHGMRVADHLTQVEAQRRKVFGLLLAALTD
jgi:glutamine amidotransferase-like uncharacterized protein